MSVCSLSRTMHLTDDIITQTAGYTHNRPSPQPITGRTDQLTFCSPDVRELPEFVQSPPAAFLAPSDSAWPANLKQSAVLRPSRGRAEPVHIPRMSSTVGGSGDSSQATRQTQPSASAAGVNKDGKRALPQCTPSSTHAALTPTSFNGPLKKRPNTFGTVGLGGIGGTGLSLGSLFRNPNSIVTAVSGGGTGVSSSASAAPLADNKNIREIKKSLTLDFTSPESAKKTLQTPDVIRFLQLTSPELERFLKQGVTEVTTPTPTQFLFPKDVTDKQRQYAQGFIDALNHLHTLNGFEPPQTNLLVSPGFAVVSPVGDRSRSEEETPPPPPASSPSVTTSSAVSSNVSAASVSPPRNNTVTVSPSSAFAPPFPKSGRVVTSSVPVVPTSDPPSATTVVAAQPPKPPTTTDTPAVESLTSTSANSTTAAAQVSAVIMQTIGGTDGSGSTGLFPSNITGNSNQNNFITSADPTTAGAISAAMQSIQMKRSAGDPQMPSSSVLEDFAVAAALVQNQTSASFRQHQQQQQSFFDNTAASSYAAASSGGAHLDYGLRIPQTATATHPGGGGGKQQQHRQGVYLGGHQHEHAPSAGVVVKQEAAQHSSFDQHSSRASSSAIPLNLADQEMLKLDRKRARNRLAATKCRKRKMERIDELQAEVLQETTERTDRDEKIAELSAKIRAYQRMVDVHRSHGCPVDNVQLPASHGSSTISASTLS